MPAWAALEKGCKRSVWLWHRRTGKDLTGLNWAALSSMRRRGLYWHLFPTYTQGRKAIWDGQDRSGRPFLDAFPKEIIHRKLDQEMTLYLHGGSIYQVVGTDHMDRLVGANPVGVILSEYALQNPAAWDLLRPILAENGGWAIFAYTPRGHNHGYRLFKQAQEHPDWFCQKLTVDDTQAIPLATIEEDRATGMPESMVQQEYWCSFSAALVGSYYGDVLEWMEAQDPPRIRSEVTHVEDKRVFTAWDLGMDTTAIWFYQFVARELRVIDYYEAAGEDISHFVRVLHGRVDGGEHRKRYIYGRALLPHDAADRTMTGPTVERQLRSLGVQVLVTPKHSLDDQHAGVRKVLRQCWINLDRCARGIDALREYVKQQVPGQAGPNGEIIYRDKPLHNWASHGASAFAVLAMNAHDGPDESGFRQPSTRGVV